VGPGDPDGVLDPGRLPFEERRRQTQKRRIVVDV
jgi:hypothetical protein